MAATKTAKAPKNQAAPTPPPATTDPTGVPSLTEQRNNLPLPMNFAANPIELNSLVYSGPDGHITGNAGDRLIIKAMGKAGEVNQTKLFRGSIIESDPSWHGGRPFALYFCFNPTDVSVTYNLESGRSYWPPSTQTQDQHGLQIAQMKTVSFSLMFDRTYEVWQGDPLRPSDGSKPGPGTYGALWDVRAAERLIGIYDANPEAPGQVSILDCQLSNYSSQTSDKLAPLNFTGWISGLAVLFSRFDMNMIPTRCEMSLTMTVTMKVPTDASPDQGGGASGDNSGTMGSPSPSAPAVVVPGTPSVGLGSGRVTVPGAP